MKKRRGGRAAWITVNHLNLYSSYSFIRKCLVLLCCRNLPNRFSQDASSSSRPSGRQQIPRDPLQRHAPCYSPGRERGGAHGSVFRVSMVDVCICLPNRVLDLLSHYNHTVLGISSKITLPLLCTLPLTKSHCPTWLHFFQVLLHLSKKGCICL